ILAALDAPGAPHVDAALHARVVTSAAHLVGSRSIFPEARELFARALTLFRQTGDRAGIASTLANLGWQTWAAGDLAQGETLSREALYLNEELGDELGAALSRNNLAWIAMERGDFDDAQRQFEAVTASHARRGDARAGAYATSWFGSLMARRGDLAQAMQLYSRALEIGARVSDTGYRLLVLVRLAATQHAAGEPGDHASLLETSYLPTLREFGRLWPLGAALTELGRMLLDLDETVRAHAVLAEALKALRATGGLGTVIEAEILQSLALLRMGDRHGATELLRGALAVAVPYGARPLMIEALEATSQLVHAAGDARRATELLAASSSAFDASGARRSPRAASALELQHQALTTSLGAEGFGDAWTSGTLLSLDDAARLALSSVTALTHD
ncbi:MAG: tetratricopeptide repeat protein, partial [bacterium]